jgi:DNA-binding NtrC family response regulator
VATTVILQNLNQKHGTRITGVDAQVRDPFNGMLGPANVRELRNVLERAAIVAREGLVRLKDMPSAALGVSPSPYSRQSPGFEDRVMPEPGQPLMKLEEAYILLTLDHVRRQSYEGCRNVWDQPENTAEPDRRIARRGKAGWA